MKKFISILICTLIMALSVPMITFANMAAPDTSDIGSSITFEKNEDIRVISEVLDIKVSGAFADIVANYNMENLSNETVSISSMFLSPNIENGKTEVFFNDNKISFKYERYNMEKVSGVGKDDWKYVVLTDERNGIAYEEQMVDTVLFPLEFKPNEKANVKVSYRYALGGRPSLDFDSKYGSIKYYLTPAQMWQGFENLTINLYLDKDMPVIRESNLDFEKIEKGVYRFTSNELPKEDLNIIIDQTKFQDFISSFKSPYLLMNVMIFLPIILLVLVIITIIIVLVVRNKKKNTKQ